jgi:peptidoglycan-N-acetylglucosamine deacetylase
MQGLTPVVLAVALLAAGTAGVAVGAECPGNPDALGTSRTIVVDPIEHPRLGSMQYRESLPLEDHEVVLTFDDGPLPPRTNHILDILAHECAKATFFMVGQMATTYPDVARKVLAAGHTVGTHSQNHPLRLHKMPLAKAEQEIDQGIVSVTAALGEPTAPFFRIPGLARTNAIDQYLASENLMTWSADFPADDWTKISPAQVYSRALQRIEANGKGILLLHDIQAKTVEALPALLHELKRRGYHIVHVVPATPDRPKTATAPSQWIMHARGRQVWPASFVEAEDAAVLPAPSPASFGAVQPFDARPAVSMQPRGRPVFRPGQAPQAPAADWPSGFSEAQAPLAIARSILPAPNPNSFSYPETSPTPWLHRKALRPVLLAPQASLAPIPVTSQAPLTQAPLIQAPLIQHPVAQVPVVTQAPQIVPPETDALALLIKRSLQETQAPNEPGTTQSIPVTPRLAPRDPVSTANMPHGAFP